MWRVVTRLLLLLSDGQSPALPHSAVLRWRHLAGKALAWRAAWNVCARRLPEPLAELRRAARGATPGVGAYDFAAAWQLLQRHVPQVLMGLMHGR